LNQPSDRASVPVIVVRADHPISRSMIAGTALKVLYRLKDAGYQGFLVGGCVRDLLIGIEPKDFVVAPAGLVEARHPSLRFSQRALLHHAHVG
jgi:poly(A) polymerase